MHAERNCGPNSSNRLLMTATPSIEWWEDDFMSTGNPQVLSARLRKAVQIVRWLRSAEPLKTKLRVWPVRKIADLPFDASVSGIRVDALPKGTKLEIVEPKPWARYVSSGGMPQRRQRKNLLGRGGPRPGPASEDGLPCHWGHENRADVQSRHTAEPGRFRGAGEGGYPGVCLSDALRTRVRNETPPEHFRPLGTSLLR
jgi:hypothetical protein